MNEKMVKQKLMGAIMAECYHKITVNEVLAFNKSGELRNGPLVKFPYEDYNSPDAFLELTREEEFVLSLMKAVRVE